ncbi:hypothetical protein SAMN04488005_2978 [Yoonia tamlensis]|uniref:DUF6473 domain-containing protein n=1 Tax=Yoonia tamlensis TaxID=390270 RepID=A0A1I6HRA3_9RHOB|nr:DUF6473 family protein [Yoonia tamlensis]SFR56983.1 hypothetical protein SAMN04488005_2978 [Yoonia tamlensis]
MKQEVFPTTGIGIRACTYGQSKVVFRGPRKSLDQPYMAFVGSTETYGKFIQEPFASLVEQELHQTCVNFGCVNGGIDAFVNDDSVLDICRGAEMTVLQIMGANNLSNRFYSVHPRRNDRFVDASSVLQAIYEDVDFSEFSFTRHMLGALHDKSPRRFEIVVNELRQAWSARMKTLLDKLGSRVVLLWFSEEPLSDQDWAMRPAQLQTEPLFITASMVDELRPLVKDVVVVNPSRAALAQGVTGMVFPPAQEAMASEMLGVRCHEEAGAQLASAIRAQLEIST